MIATSMPTSPDARILIVDSDPDFLSWASGHLKAPGVTVTTAERSEDALAGYQKQRADLVLAEVRMPGMSGSNC